MGLILPRIPTPTPVLYSAVTHPFWGYVRTQNTPKPTPKHPFSWPELELGKMNYSLGNFDPNWAKMGKPFLEVGNFFFMLDVYESFHVLEVLQTRWSPLHLFKCSTCFTHASCAHVLLASGVRRCASSLCAVTIKLKSPCNM